MTQKKLSEISETTFREAGCSLDRIRSKAVARIGLRVPVVRSLAKTSYSFVTDDRDKTLAAWDYIWRNSGCYEVMSQALYHYQYRELTTSEVKTVLGWADRVTCWEHADDLAKIYADALEADNEAVVPTLKRWNKSENSWKRRLSMTSLIEYEVKRDKVLPYKALMTFIEPLIDDDDYYVQKGLGWTIREIGNAYPEQFRKFLDNNAGRLAANAWSGATKNFDKIEKARYKAIRESQKGKK